MTSTASSTVGGCRCTWRNKKMKPYLDLFLPNTFASLLEAPENFENFNKSFPKKHLKGTVQAVTHLKKCKLKTQLEVLYCTVPYCIQRKIYKTMWCNHTFTVSYRKQPKSRLFGTPDFLKKCSDTSSDNWGQQRSSVHETGQKRFYLKPWINTERNLAVLSTARQLNTSVSDLSHESQWRVLKHENQETGFQQQTKCWAKAFYW